MSIIFLSIIVIYGFIGAGKGFINSIGGLVSMIISATAVRFLAIPVTNQLFGIFSINEKISEYISMTHTEIVESGGTINESLAQFSDWINVSALNVDSSADVLLQNINELMDNTAVHIGTMLVMIVIFSLCMSICATVVMILNKSFNVLPLGKPINLVLGFICGLIKGIILVMILYFIASCLNSIPSINIPLDDGLISHLMQSITKIFN